MLTNACRLSSCFLLFFFLGYPAIVSANTDLSMATRFFTNHFRYLKYVAECRKIIVQRRTLMNYCALNFSKGLKSMPSSSRAQFLFHSSSIHASTSTKHPDMSKLSAGNVDFCQEVLECTSSEELLNIASKRVIIAPQELVTALDCLTDKKYNELCEELPWLSRNRFRAEVQLSICYDITRRMSEVHGHPGSNVLLENLEKQRESMSNEDLASALCSLSYLNFNEAWPSFERIYEELFRRVETFSVKAIVKAARAARKHAHLYDELPGDTDNSCNKLLNLMKNLVDSNTVRIQEDSYDFMAALLSLQGKVDGSVFKRLCECVLDNMLRVSCYFLLFLFCTLQDHIFFFHYLFVILFRSARNVCEFHVLLDELHLLGALAPWNPQSCCSVTPRNPHPVGCCHLSEPLILPIHVSSSFSKADESTSHMRWGRWPINKFGLLLIAWCDWVSEFLPVFW